MYLGEVPPTTPLTQVPLQEAKSWLTQEIFWMGVWSSVLASAIVWWALERPSRRGV